eukprot:CAMPEP_0197848754 /NCGR_PEP_ID=MMETSP1438-20131217/9920_1 /TAXON_ID=1461541 /ORGANISM="Pterosperma sp., Strain CCMP1384" /LENGTH=65 /DNA_ID=CAMNT_0043461151 /DNA_START=78 /DNA_END=275 /DNA_ORIENTATION=+
MPYSKMGAIEFILRDLKRGSWPFAVGLCTYGALVTAHALTLTEEDVKNSKFANPPKPIDVKLPSL